MIEIEIFEGSPVYVEGLRAVLSATGLTVTAKMSAAEGPSWRADLFLVDPTIVDDNDLPAFIADASRVAPVLRLTNQCDEQTTAAYVAMGARGQVERRATTTTIVTAIRTVAAGGQPGLSRS